MAMTVALVVLLLAALGRLIYITETPAERAAREKAAWIARARREQLNHARREGRL